MNKIKTPAAHLCRIVAISCAITWTCLAASTATAVESDNGDLIGAAKVIAGIQKEAGSLADIPSAQKAGDSLDSIENELNRLKEKRDLPPDLAAGEWLRILDRFWKLPQAERTKESNYRGSYGSSFLLSHFIKALPGPESWPYLEKGLGKYAGSPGNSAEASALKIILLFLNEKYEELLLEIDHLEAFFSGADSYSKNEVKAELDHLRSYVIRCTIRNDRGEIISHFRRLVDARMEQPSAKGILRIPDLVAIAGETEAEKLIDQTLSIPNVVVEVPSGGDTLDLVKRSVINRIKKLDKPQWRLITSPDDIELFEVMYEKFGMEGKGKDQAKLLNVFTDGEYPDFIENDASEKLEAELYYIFGLVTSDRVDEAVRFTLNHDLADQSDYDVNKVWRRVDQSRIASSTLQYCSRVLKESPGLPFWDLYEKLAIALGEIDSYLSLLDLLSRDTGLDFKLLQKIKLQRIKAYLARGDIEKARSEAQLFVQASVEGVPPLLQEDYLEKKSDIARKMATIGKLLGRQDLVQEGLSMMQEVLADRAERSIQRDSLAFISGSAYNTQIFKWLVENDYLVLAEKHIVDSLTGKVLHFRGMEFEVAFSELSPYLADLVLLAEVYGKAGRHEDVLVLLEEAPWWGSKYLSDIYTPALTLAASRALSNAGKNDEAVRMLQDQIYKDADNDALYSALLGISGTDLIPWLDTLYERDRFEERPLIWKAVLLLQEGKLEDAESVIRQALKVDPTDGEQQAGDRVRAYAVLSEVLRAQGNESEADFFGDVVQSVRIAELGDEFNKAGLIEKSLEYYSEAEVLFGDAYCVQWRKAERLYEMGKYEEAEKHYTIAFERMPEQFGQVASFCFGCEGVFDKKHSRGIAETVLMRLEKSNPDRPQVYFLLGQLREAQEKYSESYDYFKKAVGLDPGYLDAWKRIIRLQDKVFLTQGEFNAITLTLLRLDPLKKHFYADLERVSNFAQFWPVLQESERLSNKSSLHDTLLPLKNSRETLEMHERKLKELMPERWEMYKKYLEAKRNNNEASPGTVLANHFLVHSVQRIVQMGQVQY